MTCLWGHTWKKWETALTGQIKSKPFDALTGNEQPIETIGFWEKQRRECLICGKVQLRVAKS